MIRHDQITVDDLKAGSEQAFRELVTLYKEKVYAICFRILLDREDAEDTSQETFLEIFRSIKSYRGDSALGTWIYRIAVTKSLDLIRKQKRKKRLRWLVPWLGVETQNEPVASGNPFMTLEQKELESRLHNILEKLPENQRIALSLGFVEGLSNPEIAAVLHTTVEAVEGLRKRARKKISAALLEKG